MQSVAPSSRLRLVLHARKRGNGSPLDTFRLGDYFPVSAERRDGDQERSDRPYVDWATF